MLLGLVGTRCSGKSTVARMLGEQGFEVITLTSILREEAAIRGLPSTQESLFSIANELRSKFGPAVLMERALNRLQDPGKDMLIVTIRNVSELGLLRERGGSVLGVDADYEVRYKRACERQALEGTQEWAATEEEFRRHDDGGDNQGFYRPSLHDLLTRVDTLIDNTGSIDETKRKVLSALEELRRAAPSSGSTSSPQ